jgi:NADH-quinone oxidoreductase subunit J
MMNFVFYLAAAVAVVSTFLVITSLNAVHALLYMILSLLSMSIIFFTLGAPFVSALEVIIYAGAIMVLFIFVVMMLNLGPQSSQEERLLLDPKMWRGPAVLATILIAELAYLLSSDSSVTTAGKILEPTQISISLFGPYLLGVELASILLLAGLVGAYHLGRRD